jgi:hypothetical protein
MSEPIDFVAQTLKHRTVEQQTLDVLVEVRELLKRIADNTRPAGTEAKVAVVEAVKKPQHISQMKVKR